MIAGTLGAAVIVGSLWIAGDANTTARKASSTAATATRLARIAVRDLAIEEAARVHASCTSSTESRRQILDLVGIVRDLDAADGTPSPGVTAFAERAGEVFGGKPPLCKIPTRRPPP